MSYSVGQSTSTFADSVPRETAELYTKILPAGEQFGRDLDIAITEESPDKYVVEYNGGTYSSGFWSGIKFTKNRTKPNYRKVFNDLTIDLSMHGGFEKPITVKRAIVVTSRKRVGHPRVNNEITVDDFVVFGNCKIAPAARINGNAVFVNCIIETAEIKGNAVFINCEVLYDTAPDGIYINTGDKNRVAIQCDGMSDWASSDPDLMDESKTLSTAFEAYSDTLNYYLMISKSRDLFNAPHTTHLRNMVSSPSYLKFAKLFRGSQL